MWRRWSSVPFVSKRSKHTVASFHSCYAGTFTTFSAFQLGCRDRRRARLVGRLLRNRGSASWNLSAMRTNEIDSLSKRCDREMGENEKTVALNQVDYSQILEVKSAVGSCNWIPSINDHSLLRFQLEKSIPFPDEIILSKTADRPVNARKAILSCSGPGLSHGTH